MASSSRSAHLFDPSLEDARKRVSKACDRCRLKKIKCDGKVPCSRCQSDSTICRYGERKKSVERRIPPGYVDYLEEQQKVLVQALRKVWNERTQASPSAAEPSVNHILASLGVLEEFTRDQPGRENFSFEEDFETIRRRLEEEEESVVTSASSARSSPGRSSIAAPAEPYRDPFTNQGTLSLPSSSQFRYLPQEQRQPNYPSVWRGMMPESYSSPSPQQQQPPQFSQPMPQLQPSRRQQEIDWARESPHPQIGLEAPSPGRDDRRATLSPFAPFSALSQQFPTSPSGFSQFRASPQPAPSMQQQGSQSGNTPASNPWLVEDDEAWRAFINERRE